jgi:transposase
VQTLISSYPAGDLGGLFAQSRPGRKSQPKKDAARERVVRMRRERHGIEETVAELERAGTPTSRMAVWELLREAGLSRIPKRLASRCPRSSRPSARACAGCRQALPTWALRR